jgi:murein DD-endopeptidase MepM/ murein hydrolase activator NlpD
MQRLLGKYMTENGLTQISQGLLAKYALPEINKAQSELMSVFRKEHGIAQSAMKRDELMANFVTDKRFGDLLLGLSVTYDERGNPLGFPGAWKTGMTYIKDMFDAGMINENDLVSIESQVDPQTSKTFKQRWPVKFQLLREELAAANRQNSADEEAEIAMKAKDAERELMDFFNQNPDQATEINIKKAQQDFFQKFTRKSDALSTLESTYSVDALGAQRLNDQFKNLAEQNMLTPQMVSKAPWEVQQKWMSVATKQEEARSKTGSFKNELKAIEQHVKNQPSVRAMYGGQVSGIGQLVIGELQAKFNRKVAEYIATGQVSPQEAASVAMKEVMSEFDNPTGRYAINSQGDFTNFKFGSAKTSKSLNLKLNKIRTALAYGGKGSLDNKPGLIFDAGELQAIEQGYGKPGFTMPAEAQYWGSKLGISPLEVINRQRRAAGMNELATPAAMERIQGTISPQLQGILNRYQSYNRSVRALSSMGRFEPAAVPKGFGGTIQTAAKANGIDPAILAGLLEVESRWRDDVIYGKTRSKKGARGIAQIMPEYHPGVNYDDPNASINYAAKYLSSLQRQFGGDMRLALIAYNAGPGNVEKYRGPIPGDAESSSYYSNVIKSAAKYGYGRAWQDPATMRSKFASSITFDSGQPGIDVYFDDKNFTTVLPGRVKEVGNQTTAGGNGYGNYVVVESIDPLTQRPVDVLYAHLDSINVKEGQSLKAGSRIGRQGGTGRVVSQDGTIASIDFLAPAPKGSKSMAPYSGYEQLRRYIAKNLRQG